MGAFSDLLQQLHAKGERFVTFTVDLRGFFASPENEAWRAELDEPDRPAEQGRTGEEALRRLVERLTKDGA
jgi:hypothetical protein